MDVEIEVSKNQYETTRLQSDKREEWIREVRRKRLQGMQPARVALSVWPTHKLRYSPGEMSVWEPIVA